MMKKHGFLLFLFFQISLAIAQKDITFPKDNDTLNFTEFYIELPFNADIKKYEIEILNPYQVKNNYFTTNYTYYLKNLLPNKTYQWRYRAFYKNNKNEAWSDWKKFHIMNFDVLDKSKYEMLCINKLDNNFGTYFFIDGLKSIIDKEFNIIWHYPFLDVEGDKRVDYRDFRMLDNGNITFLHNGEPNEITLNGNIVWTKRPSDRFLFHHDYKTLKNGNKLFLAEKVISKKINPKDTFFNSKFPKYPPLEDSVQSILYDYSCIEEYNQSGEKVWSWCYDSIDKKDSYCTRKPKNGFPNGNFHSNAFCINEQTNDIYIGFRDISRIIKVNKNTGISSNILPTNDCAHDFYMYQHELELLDSNHLLIFSNNACGEVDNGRDFKPSSIVKLKLAPKVEKEWEIICDPQNETRVYAMGGVQQICDSLLLINLGTDNRTIVKNLKTEKIDWSLKIIYKKDGEIIGKPIKGSYRSHIVSSLYPNYTYFATDKNIAYIFNGTKQTQTYFLEIKNSDKQLFKSEKIAIQPFSGKRIKLDNKKLIKGNSISLTNLKTATIKTIVL